MRKKLNRKELVLKKIKHRHDEVKYVEKNKNMNERDRRRIYGDNTKPLPILKRERIIPSERTKLRDGTLNVSDLNKIKKLDNKESLISHEKKAFVDYDVVICIPSYNRYKKVNRLIKQFYNQPTKYTFKIILLNDGSDDKKYKKFSKKYSEITYIENEKPNGKVMHWFCYNQMWEFLKNIECHVVLQMDDDFILCDNFLDTITDTFFSEKEKNNHIVAVSPHLWSFKHKNNEKWWGHSYFVDGIALIDSRIIEFMNYEMQPVNVEEVSKAGSPVRAWTQIGLAIYNTNNRLYRTPYSLVYHDGNDDSKLHSDVRGDGKNGVYTQKYIGKL